MKTIKTGRYLPMILLLFISSIAYCQEAIKSLNRDEVNQVIQWGFDVSAYKQAYTSCDSTVSLLERTVKNDSILLNQANKVTESKVRVSNFFEGERNFERNKNVDLQGKIAKVERQNKFWRVFAGCATAVVIYEFMKHRGL